MNIKIYSNRTRGKDLDNICCQTNTKLMMDTCKLKREEKYWYTERKIKWVPKIVPILMRVSKNNAELNKLTFEVYMKCTPWQRI